MQEQVQQLPDHVLIKIIKEIYKLSKGEYREYEGFIKKVAAIYKSITAPNPKEAKKEKTLDEDKKIIDRFMNDIEIATIKLNSVNKVDSEMNDLEILRCLADIAKLLSKVSVNIKGFEKIAERASIAYKNISLVTGNSADVMQSGYAQQKNKVDAISLSKSIKFNLQEGTSSVDFKPPITKEHEQKRNKAYAESVNALISKERKNH